jgi:hypothetical protein
MRFEREPAAHVLAHLHLCRAGSLDGGVKLIRLFLIVESLACGWGGADGGVSCDGAQSEKGDS